MKVFRLMPKISLTEQGIQFRRDGKDLGAEAEPSRFFHGPQAPGTMDLMRKDMASCISSDSISKGAPSGVQALPWFSSQEICHSVFRQASFMPLYGSSESGFCLPDLSDPCSGNGHNPSRMFRRLRDRPMQQEGTPVCMNQLLMHTLP
jgi:hypothetical protein